MVDRYGDVLVTESLTVGMERLRPVLFPLLARIVGEHGTPVRGIFERNDARIREKEGLPLYKGWYDLEGLPTPESARLVVAENGVRYNIDVENSQKTGFFLDQKYNRRAVARLAQGRRVLDCFTHVGTFALNCAVAGAEFVHGVDISATAVDCCRHNAELNGVADRTRFTCANVFDLLTGLDGDRDAMREEGPSTSSCSTRRRSPRTARPSTRPPAATARSTTVPCACCRAAATWPPAAAPTSWTTSCSAT